MTPAQYQTITQATQEEITRLTSKGREQKALGQDNTELYREWAYGAFLLWKKLVGQHGRTSDALYLENLANSEMPF